MIVGNSIVLVPGVLVYYKSSFCVFDLQIYLALLCRGFQFP